MPFEDQDFRFAALPFFKLHFGQTNYRVYVIDTVTGRRAVWFFGTLLDSWSVVVPRNGWRLPWHRGRIRFDEETAPVVLTPGMLVDAHLGLEESGVFDLSR